MMSFHLPTVEQLLPAFPFPLHVLTASTPILARLGFSFLLLTLHISLPCKLLQLLGLCLSSVSLVHLSVLDSQESAVGMFVVGQEHYEHHLSTHIFKVSTVGQARSAL